MHSLFNLSSPMEQGVLKFPEWAWVRDGLRRVVGSTIGFYRSNPMAVHSDHFLVRLLGSISVPKSQPLERYFDNVDAMALNLAMALKMTSSIYQGALHHGVFYGAGTQEILLAHTASFDFRKAHRDWQNIQAVQVLRTPRSDFGFNLPDGQASGSETGLAVIAIDIPMLAIQYRAFRLQEQELAQAGEERSLMQFVHQYVLPNMLWSQTEQVLFNRINLLSQERPLGMSHQHHSFMIPAVYGAKATTVLREVLQSLELVGKDFRGILKSIPAVFHPDMEAVMRLPSMAQTRQVQWALTLSRLHALGFLFRESKWGAQMRDQREVNTIARSMLAYKTGNVLQQYVSDKELLYQVQAEINEILALPHMLAAANP